MPASLLAAALFALCAPGPRTTCVVDGDAFWLGGEKVRIADINAPETHTASCPEERARGLAAAAALVRLLNAGPIALEPWGTRARDRYGRRLAVVTRGGQSLGAQLVAARLAEPWQGRRGDWCGKKDAFTTR